MSDFVADLTLHIKPQVDLVEVPMKRDRDPAHSRVQELKADRGDERAAMPEIELGPGWDSWGEYLGPDLVIDHHEVAPFRRQKAIPS
jgi:hypothetical protein